VDFHSQNSKIFAPRIANSNTKTRKMKYFSFLLLAAVFSGPLGAQSIQEISTGTGYRKQSYVNLSAGTQKQVDNTSWDIAFTVYGQQDAGVYLNESAGSSMGQPLPQAILYDAQTTNFADQPDPANLTAYRLLNTEKNWSYGAFNETRNPGDVFDYGWGRYNFQSNQVVGSKVYVIKLRNGQFRKIKIESLTGTTWTFRYASLDGTGEVVKTINKADHAGKTLAYFSLETGNMVDVEPATGGFDLLYERYTTKLWDPGTQTWIDYDVAGVLHGLNSQVAELDNVDPLTVTYSEAADSFKTELDVIGHDWKSFSGTAWSIDDNKVFFLKNPENRVWKLHFIDFEGSSTGTAILEKTNLGIVSAVTDPAAIGVQVLTWPNPVVSELFVSLDIPAELTSDARLRVVDAAGRLVAQQPALREGFQMQQIDAAQWTPGLYVVQLEVPGHTVTLGKVVKQ
jgi:hypothetical protein